MEEWKDPSFLKDYWDALVSISFRPMAHTIRRELEIIGTQKGKDTKVRTQGVFRQGEED